MKQLSASLKQLEERRVRLGIVVCLLALALLVSPPMPSMPGAHAQSATALARGWQHIQIRAPSGLAQGEGPTRVVAAGRGLVAFALTQGPGVALWDSADGRTWRSLPSPAFQSGEQPVWFYGAGRILVITGSAGTQPLIWASQDEGATWHESPNHIRITALAAGGDGVIAFSDDSSSSSSTSVWTSADGVTWRRVQEAATVFASAAVTSLAQTSHGLVAGGSLNPPGQRAAIWTSPNGRIWTQVPDGGGIFDANLASYVNDVVGGPRGMLAIGQRILTVPTGQVAEPDAWASPDGVHWQRAVLPFNDPNEYFGQVVAWQGGFVQFDSGNGSDEAVVWASPDGLTWTPVGSDEVFGGTARIWSATQFQGGLAAAGSFALPPKPGCLELTLDDVRLFHPAVFLWNPAASARAPAPTIDRSDPRALKLLPSDGVRDGVSAYVYLCALDPALGPHRAYLLHFDTPHIARVNGTSISDTALSIVTRSAATATAAFQHVDRLLVPSAAIQRKRELPVGAHIGEATRVFRLQVLETEEGDNNRFTLFAVAWRKGPVIGIVITGDRQEAVQLAQKQLAHLEHL